MKWKKFIPGRRVWAAGLSGLVAFAVAAALNIAGYPVGYDAVLEIVIILAPTVGFVVPDSATDIARKLNDEIIELAVLMPESAATAEGAQRVAEKVLAPFPPETSG